jgi:hypothetical protein
LSAEKGRIDKTTNLVHVFMDRGPITGYTGYIVLAPAGAPPPKVEPPLADEDEEGDEFED